MGIATIPDTALLIRQRPFFLPDFCEKICTTQLCICARINRLGRSINIRFAHRYYDANDFTLGVHFVARNLLNQLLQTGQPIDPAVGFDNAVAVAEEKANLNNDNLQCEIKLDNEVHRVQMNLKQMQAAIDNEIARISQFYTLRQGDLLLLPLPIEELPVKIGNKLCLSLNEKHLLTFDVK